MVEAQLNARYRRKFAPSEPPASQRHRFQPQNRYSPQASCRADAMALQSGTRRRPRWSIWKVAGLVYFGAFIVYAHLYATKQPLGTVSDMLVQSLAFALIWAWLAGVAVAIRNRLTA